eukprot:jgi/Tetstr1/445980/TSEL_003537.t1
MSSRGVAPVTGGGGRECAGVCLELLSKEMVRVCRRAEGGPPASTALESIGVRVGRQMIDRMTADRPRFGEPLEVIKFICKEFWAEMFQKQADNLKTNHRGTFVLQDNRFRWLARLAPDANAAKLPQVSELAQEYLHFPCGIIRGALSNLGVNCTVTADATHLPGCAFTIRMKSA